MGNQKQGEKGVVMELKEQLLGFLHITPRKKIMHDSV